MFKTVLIANRGAIACRILRSLRALGIRGVAVYAEADSASLHVEQADRAISLGEGAAAATYLDSAKILAAARACGAEAIHPGYGFLSENAAFAEACEAAGIAFIGPTPAQMRQFGLKHTARALAQQAGLPLLTGSGLLESVAHAQLEAAQVGYPVMLKSTAGGGGIGMRVCRDADDLAAHFGVVKRLGESNFRDGGVFLEKYIDRARHIEVQIFGDGEGSVIALGERDCSIQRRNQKVLEESPAPNLAQPLREALHEAAVKLAQSVNYRSAGTVEFVYDDAAQQFHFLEVNTRLQVEHGVTEQVYGVDLVRWMIELAAGALPPLEPLGASLEAHGHAVQARLYAEDPGKDFQPSPGLLTQLEFPAADGKSLRIDTWIEAGCEIPPHFDPLLAKLIAWAPDREAALAGLDRALADTRLYGVETNREYLRQILAFEPFRSGRPWTRCLEGLRYFSHSFEVIAPGTQTTVQDLPGRLGYWDVGVPPSGPMDARSMQAGNRLLGNAPGAAALEITLAGPTLRFNTDAVLAVTGAEIPLSLDGVPVAMTRGLSVAAGSTLAMGCITGPGARAYLCVLGGIQVPDYLGSGSTFTLGQFGGHAGRALRVGDVLHLPHRERHSFCRNDSCVGGNPVPQTETGFGIPADNWIPAYAGMTGDVQLEPLRLEAVRTLRVLLGPHAAPEYFSDKYLAEFFAAEWEVHFNSSRTGVRLIGPKPEWTRSDGGEAGLHPSNIHDNAYAIGAVDFTGDMPVILGPDGPSLGGFVCPVTVIEADLWQLGQLRAGDRLRFVAVDYASARAAVGAQAQPLAVMGAVLLDEGRGDARLVARLAGDTYLLLEFGAAEIDLATRFRADALMTELRERNLPGVNELTPGIRSLQIHYQPEAQPLAGLLTIVRGLWARLASAQDLSLPSRIVHLPLSWDDPATRVAIDKYMTTVRKDAPWCPSNLEFIRRINGLDSIDDVKRIVFDASYLVMGLGDVYLGAPVATPLDPRHRLVTTKYNPARTWTPENAVGIGGAYLCVYGMEGPGGYQFVGRTLQMWNRYKTVASFHRQPYLLRFFDQIRFFEVRADELLQIRRDFPLGRYPLRIEDSRLSLADYQRFLDDNATGIARFRTQQRAAFADERAHWAASGLANFEAGHEAAQAESADVLLAQDETGVYSPVAGNLWQLKVQPGQRVEAGQPLAVLEAMKMEIQVPAPIAGIVRRCFAQPGAALRAGQTLMSVVASDPG